MENKKHKRKKSRDHHEMLPQNCYMNKHNKKIEARKFEKNIIEAVEGLGMKSMNRNKYW